MEKKNNFLRVGSLSVLRGVLAILLCAAPSLHADVTVPAGETWDIDYDVTGNLWVEGTANILAGAHITQELGAFPCSTLNIYGGQVDWWLITYISGEPTENPNVTVYGTKFKIGIGDAFLPPADLPIPDDTLYVLSESGNVLFSLSVMSEIAIHLRAPDNGPILVDIDIKPGSDPNPINQGSNGLIPVAIFTTDWFNAADVDPGTVTLNGTGVAVRGKAEKLMARLEDVDGDGDDDLILQVETQSEGVVWEAGPVTLTGKTYGGEDIKGTDEVVIVPPE